MVKVMTGKETETGAFILIVEDDSGTVELEARRLEPLGIEIRCVSTPAETLEILKNAQPVLMILDYSFPGMNAFELLARLKDSSIPVPPFIVVTGRGDEAVAVESMKAGALDYIIKDAAFLENLLSTVKKALEKATLQLKLKKTEGDLEKSLRLYNFLAHVNQAAALEKDKKELFAEICAIAVNKGGFRMAWIGVPDKDIGRVLPLCSAGFVEGYLDSIKITLSEGPHSKGPTASGIRTGRITVISDISTDPAMEPWREQALKRGYRSSASIPLKEEGRTVATLNLYSAEPDFFTGGEQKLLAEIEGDISLALDAISAEEKRAASQSALERTAGQLAHIMEANPVMLFTLKSRNGRTIFEWVSGNAQDLTGYEPAEILAPGWLENNLHPLDKDWALASMQDILRKGSGTHDFRFRKKDGTYFWVHCQAKASSTGTGEMTSSWTDITLLKESEMRFQELFEKAPVGYQSLDIAGNLLAINETWARTFGYSREEVLGRNFADFLSPGQKALFGKSFEDFKAAGEIAGGEYNIRCKDGASRRLSYNGRIVYNQNGSFRHTHCVFTDITDTWKAREQTDLLGQAVRSSFNEVYIFSPENFHIIFANYTAVKNLGYAPEELENMTPWDLKHKFPEASFRAAVKPLLDGSLPKLVFESEHTRKDGTSYPVEVRLQLVQTGEKRAFLAIINDITERKTNERIISEMAVMQRMESLGLLAGGIAHDFNNMLTGILANITLLKTRCGEENKEILEETIEAATNARSLTAKLLAFSKGGKPVKKEFCLEKALGDIFRLATSGAGATCEIAVSEDLWSVEADENQVKQTVNNLLINALQAMPSGGKLKLEAKNLSSENRPPEPLSPGRYVKITVTDTGVGIPENYLSKVFDPYFTTKDRGHGLGLSMAWSTIKNHGGHMTVASTPGKGASFDVYLPSSGRCLKNIQETKTEVIKGSGRILVLDDEEIVSKALKRMLAELGYACEIVTDGKDAVRRYAEEENTGKPFAAVIMDLTIPGGMGGKWAVLQIREAYPGAKVIVSSGYSDNAEMADYKASGFNAILPKPYSYEDLARTLAGLLTK